MADGPRIAIDAMGGDSGPAAMIAGASRARHRDPSLEFLIYGAEAAGPRRARTQCTPRFGLHHRPFARGDRSDRKAEPGDPPRPHHLDGHGDQRGEGRPRRCRGLRRQYRRDDGDVEARAAHHAGDRPAGARRLAPDARRNRLHHARPRRQYRMRCAKPGSVRGHGRGLRSHRSGHRPAARENAQHRHRGTEGHRRAQGSRRPVARGRLSALPVRRLHRGRPAVARAIWTSS